MSRPLPGPRYHHPFPTLFLWIYCDFDEDESQLMRLLGAHVASISEATKRRAAVLAEPTVPPGGSVLLATADQVMRDEAAAWPDRYGRQLMYGFLLIVYSEYEAMLCRFCEAVAELANVRVSPKQVENAYKAGSFLVDRLRLRVPSGGAMAILDELRRIRNAIVHRAGRPIQSDALVHLRLNEDGRIVADEEFCAKYPAAVGTFFTELRELNEAAFVKS